MMKSIQHAMCAVTTNDPQMIFSFTQTHHHTYNMYHISGEASRSDVIIQQIPDAYNAYRTNGSITKIFVFGKHEVNVINDGLAEHLAQYEGSIAHGILCNFWYTTNINTNFNWFQSHINDEFKALDLKSHLRSGRDIIIPCDATSQSLDPNEFCQSVEDDALKSKYIKYIEDKIKQNAQFDVVRRVSMISQANNVPNNDDQKVEPAPHVPPRRRRSAMFLAAIQSGTDLKKAPKQDRKKVKGVVGGGMFDISGVKLRSVGRPVRSQSYNAKSSSTDFRSLLKKKSAKKTDPIKEDCDRNQAKAPWMNAKLKNSGKKSHSKQAKVPSWMNTKLRKVNRSNTVNTSNKQAKTTCPREDVRKESTHKKEEYAKTIKDCRECRPDEMLYTNSTRPHTASKQKLVPPPPPPRVLPKCIDCDTETHDGKVDEVNQFYCNGCWRQYEYVDEKHNQTHAKPTKDIKQKPLSQIQNKRHDGGKAQLFADIRKGKKLKEVDVDVEPEIVVNKQQSVLFEKIVSIRHLVADPSNDIDTDSENDWDCLD
eukprot:1068436_1